MNKINNSLKLRMTRAGVFLLGLTLAPRLVVASTNPYKPANIAGKVRHELVMLPYFSIFDNLNFEMDGGNVTLFGDVRSPTLKISAERVVQRIEGVESVTNKIHTLPVSPMDDHIRMTTARAIYGYGPLQRYRLGAQPPIRIIVENGHVTLRGFVANEMDKNLAFIRANQVPGVFSVTNELRVDKPSRS